MLLKAERCAGASAWSRLGEGARPAGATPAGPAGV